MNTINSIGTILLYYCHGVTLGGTKNERRGSARTEVDKHRHFRVSRGSPKWRCRKRYTSWGNNCDEQAVSQNPEVE